MTAALRLCSCGQPTRTPRHARCDIHAGTHTRVDAIVDPGARYADDPAAQMIANRGGSTLEMVAAALGITRERVRQIQADGIRKLGPRLRLVGITAEDIGEILAARGGSQDVGGVPISERSTRSAHVQAKRAQGAWSRGYVPVERLPEGAWSEHGQRVEAALVAAETAVARAELASLRGRGAET